MSFKTGLYIMQQMALEVGYQKPSTAVSGGLGYDERLQAILYATCEQIREKKCFIQQERVYTITTTSGRSDYPFPQDFFGQLLNSQYDRSNSIQLVGPMAEGPWNYRVYRTGASQYYTGFRVFGWDQNVNTLGGQIKFNPTPATGTVIGLDYVTSTMFLPAEWLPATSYAQNVYVNASGNIYQKTDAGPEVSGALATIPVHTSGSVTGSDNITWLFVDTPKETITADTDLCIFDPRLVINGMKSLWSASKTFDPSYYEAAFELSLSKALARYTGSISGNVGDYSDEVWPKIVMPDGSYS